MSARQILICCALSGGLAVALGAFGAHGLTSRLEPVEPAKRADRLATYRTAADYHLTHSLALGLVAVLMWASPAESRRFLRAAKWSGGCFLLGIVLFAGPLYVLGAVGGPSWLGAVAPVGGTLLLAGWGALLLAGWSVRTAQSPRV